MVTEDQFDVAVVGRGTAGLASAISAQENGANVVLLEKAPKDNAGGQSQYVGTTRVPTAEIDVDLDIPYSEYKSSDFYQDIMKQTQSTADPELTQALVNNAAESFEWLYEHTTNQGFVWEEDPDRTGYELEPKAIYGDEITGALTDVAESLGVDILYKAEARRLCQDDTTHISGLVANVDGKRIQFEVGAVVIACGGFESNAEKRTRYMGGPYEEMKVRGVRYNTGEAIDMALDIGAKATGQWSGAHMSPIDARAPDVEGGSETTVYNYPYGILINHNGERFLDEGADTRDRTYAKYGRKVFEQPYRESFIIQDSETNEHRQPSVDPVSADSIEQLVRRLGIENEDKAIETFHEYNDACEENAEIDITSFDNVSTEGITPQKSNWAKPLTEKPLYGYPVTGGITFTFGGLAKTTNSEVLDTSDNPIPGLFAAGNATGGILFYNYPGGTAQTKAYVFGKIAGENAAKIVE